MVKKKKGISFKLNSFEVELSNRWMYSMMAFFVIALLGAFVYAQAPNPGHAYDDLDLGPLAISGSDVNIEGSLKAGESPSYYALLGFDVIGNDIGLTSGGDAIAVKDASGNFFYGGVTYADGIFIDGNTKYVGIGKSNPQTELDVSGTVKAGTFIGDGSQLTGISGAWTKLGSDIHYNDGNVGVGTASPGYKLEVNGSVKADSFVGDGSQLTGIDSSPWTKSGDNIYYNDGNVGIGTSNPGAAKLLVDGYTKLGGSDNLVVFSHNGNNVAGVHRGQLFSRSGTLANGRVWCDSSSYGVGLLSQGASYVCNNPKVRFIDGNGNLIGQGDGYRLASAQNHHNAYCLALGYYGPAGTPSTEESQNSRAIWSNSNRRWGSTGSGEVITSLECWIGN